MTKTGGEDKVDKRPAKKGCENSFSESEAKGGIYRFPPPTDILHPQAELRLLKELYGEIVKIINERGGKATLTEENGYPSIITFLPHEASIATTAEVLFSDEWHKRLTPAMRRTIIFNMMQAYRVIDRAKPGEKLQ